MKNKISILGITIIVTIIIFSISTYLQKQLINYEPTISCLTLNTDILSNEKLNEEMFKIVEMPISIVQNTRIIQSFSEIEGLYAKDDIYKNQIAMREQFDTKENLLIYEVEENKEKISIKISAAENGISFAVRENSLINLYVTIRSEYATPFLEGYEYFNVGDEYSGYTVVKLLDKVNVLGVFNVDGIPINDTTDSVIDTIMVPVTLEEAKQINLLREIGTFNITGISNNYKEDYSESSNNEESVEKL